MKRPRNLRKRVMVLLLLLSAGAIVNVAVAWGIQLANGCALDSMTSVSSLSSDPVMRDLTDTEMVRLQSCGFHSLQSESANKPVVLLSTDIDYGTGISIYGLYANREERSRNNLDDSMPRDRYFLGNSLGPAYSAGYFTKTGWPAATLSTEYWGTSGPRGRFSNRFYNGSGLRVPSLDGLFPPEKGYTLPLRPIWSGFAINTLFYAAIFWLLLFAPFQIRRALRIRRARCPKCAYDLRGSSLPAPTSGGAPGNVCPECGTAP